MPRRTPSFTGLIVGALAFCVLFAPPRLAAQEGGGPGGPPPSPAELVRVAEPVAAKAARGATIEVSIPFTVLAGWHVNAHRPNEDFMVPTVLTLKAAPGVRVGAPRYPEAKQVNLSFSETPLAVYEENTTIVVPLTVDAMAAEGARTLSGTLRFQACNNEVCLPPSGVPVRVALTIEGGGAPTDSAPATIVLVPTADSAASADAPFDSGLTVSSLGTASGTGGPGGAAAGGAGNLVGGWFAERGSLLAFLFIFFLGLLLNLTPCVYPMMGVTVSLFGGTAAGASAAAGGAGARPGVAAALPRALVYVLGICFMYSTLGVAAALTGSMFGGWLANPWVLGFIGLFLLVMALAMFGVYELSVPSSVLTRLGGATGAGFLGTFVAGLLVGVFAAPCIGAPILALVAYVGAKGDPLFGFWAFFVLSLGLGFPYLVLATSSGLLTRLPRSGSWMDWVKHLFGVVLLGVAAFYLTLAVAPAKVGWVVPAALFLGGLYLGFLEPTGRERMGFRRFKWAVGLAGIVAATMIAFRPPARTIEWQPFAEETLARAVAEGRPVLLDFSADWCVPCHELDENTFTHPDVVRATESFVRMKVDLTHLDAPGPSGLRTRFAVEGVPTVVFLAPDGSEVTAARVVGFLGPQPFLERVRLAGGAAVAASREPSRP